MTSSEDERRVLRDAIDVLRLRDAVGNAPRIDRFAMALSDHEHGNCPSGVRDCAAVAVAREVLEGIG